MHCVHDTWIENKDFFFLLFIYFFFFGREVDCFIYFLETNTLGEKKQGFNTNIHHKLYILVLHRAHEPSEYKHSIHAKIMITFKGRKVLGFILGGSVTSEVIESFPHRYCTRIDK